MMMSEQTSEDSKDGTISVPVTDSASINSWDTLFLTRTLKENHDGRMNDVVMCPVRECSNLCATAGGNQVCIYDTCHRGNFLDLSHLYVCTDQASVPSHDKDIIMTGSDLEKPHQSEDGQTSAEFLSVCWPNDKEVVTDLTSPETHPFSCPDSLIVAAGDSIGRLHVISVEWSRCLQIIQVCKAPIIQIEPVSETKVICLTKDFELYQVEVITKPTSISSEPVFTDDRTDVVKKLWTIPSNACFALNPNRNRVLVVNPFEKQAMEIELCSSLPTPARMVEFTVRTGTLDHSKVKSKFDIHYLNNNQAMISVTGGQFHLLDLEQRSVELSFRIGVTKFCDPPLFDIHQIDESILVVSLDDRNSSLIYDWKNKKSIIELSHTKKKSGMRKAVFAYGSHPFRSVITICNRSIIWKWDEPSLVKDFFHTCSFFDDYSVFSKYGKELPNVKVLSSLVI